MKNDSRRKRQSTGSSDTPSCDIARIEKLGCRLSWAGEFQDENVQLIESNCQLRSRIAELIGSRINKSGDEGNVKMVEELREELHRANLEIKRFQDAIESNPMLTEALVNAEEG